MPLGTDLSRQVQPTGAVSQLHRLNIHIATILKRRANHRHRLTISTQCLHRPFQAGASSEKPDNVVLQAAAVDAPSELTQDRDSLTHQWQRIKTLISSLASCPTYHAKLEQLKSDPVVARFLRSTPQGDIVQQRLEVFTDVEAYCLLAVVAMGQQHVFTVMPRDDANVLLDSLAATLVHVEEFYDCIGGILGYQCQCTKFLLAMKDLPCEATLEDANFLVPRGLSLSNPESAEKVAAATVAGIKATPFMAEIYPLGGAGDRLGLSCEETGESLPTAVLPYCGRSLLEALIRDVQAREYLHYRIFGKQYTTPIAVMTSAAKGNHWRVLQLFQSSHWFGRGRESFNLFQQPLVPMVSETDGQWLVDGPLQVMMKPGGHGVIWKLMHDQDVFRWLQKDHGREAAIVRQISNPMAGQDTTLLALAGEGRRGSKSFGFASCERTVGAAEGMNVLLQRQIPGINPNGTSRYVYHVTNIEYTEFERLGIEDKEACDGSPVSQFPANTNVLYVGLSAVESVLNRGVEAGDATSIIPGVILNTSKKVCYRDGVTGEERLIHAGRLECTMQNLADRFATELPRTPYDHSASGDLDTFLVYGRRRKVTSSAKRSLKPGSSKITQTPPGSFYDLMANAKEMLTQYCGMTVPDLGTVNEYLKTGPGFLFFFHPALGPLWEVVAQKVRGGRIADRAEVQLEVAEAVIENLDVEGSLLIKADAVLGHTVNTRTQIDNSRAHHNQHNNINGHRVLNGAVAAEYTTTNGNGIHNNGQNGVDHHHEQDPELVFSDRCGRVRLHNVTIRNAGVDWDNPHNVYWRHKVARKESCCVILHGASEFCAKDVVLRGDLKFEVPDGYRMEVRSGGDDGLLPVVNLHPLGGGPTWTWSYSLTESDQVKLDLVESSEE